MLSDSKRVKAIDASNEDVAAPVTELLVSKSTYEEERVVFLSFFGTDNSAISRLSAIATIADGGRSQHSNGLWVDGR